MTEVRGFLVAAWEETRTEGDPATRILMTGRLEDGRSFAIVDRAPPPALFVAHRHLSASMSLLSKALPGAPDASAWTDLAGAELARLDLPAGTLRTAERVLTAAHLPIVGRERPRADALLLARGIQGPLAIRGEPVPGRRVDVVFVEPTMTPARTTAALAWMAIDLETDRDGRIVAASLAGKGGPGEVLFVGPRPRAANVTAFASEKELLVALSQRIVARDPDVITGWNVVDFDMRVLMERHTAHRLPFDAGRTGTGATLVERTNGKPVVSLPGRVVIDAMRLVRGSGERFEDLSLDSIAQSVLGEKKTVSVTGLAKVAELERLRRDDPDAFCAYCLHDSELVLRILAKTGLDELTARRAALTGVSLHLAWTSIPAFERIYAGELRARRVVPPPRLEEPVSGAAGGTVLEPAPGFFPNVLVFDFRSLYPSIMRTFNIDPLAHARAEARHQPDDLVAPNGARFTRATGALPEIITRYAEEREAAIAQGDDTAAYVYKILQNSFYGVLGSPGCRYGRTELAGAITSFGKKFLTAARDFFEARGLRVLYGDTDSVFVLSGLGDASDYEALSAFGERAAQELNAVIGEQIRAEYGVASHLRIRSEKAYRRFFIPRLRTDPSGDGRGRAKGYAGLRVTPDGSTELEVRGMEAARSDFTPLARRFQLELLEKAFAGATDDELRTWCGDLRARLQSGALDDELVYRKALRRPAEEYGSETPQVRAARMLGWTARRGRISYVMTRAGAEPMEARTSAPLDYAHYLERQLLPIARSVGDALGRDADAWFGGRPQLDLFDA